MLSVTTAANSVLSPIHNRMPVIIRPEEWDEWLAPNPLADDSFQRITTPYPANEITALEVSPLVNSARLDDPRCCLACDLVEAEVPKKLWIKRNEAVKQDAQQTFGF